MVRLKQQGSESSLLKILLVELLFQNMIDDRGAIFSDCGKYRYVLWRRWDASKPSVLCIGLNPSTATKDKPDPTITRVIDLIKSAGYGGFYMMNLFAFITPYPKELKKCPDALGENNKWLTDIASKCEDTIFCWGAFSILSLVSKFSERVEFIIEMFPEAYCFGKTKNGEPRHPLMLRKKTPLEKFIL
jgi:hypothetical protein